MGKAFKHDHVVTVVGSLNACFERLSESQFDLIMLDLGLPESDGIETLENFFRVLGPSNPVIVLTANSGNGIGEEALRIGAIDFLIKGEFGADRLARAVRYGLERWRQRLELEEAQRNLKSFAHVAAHDLKSPVKSIGMYADFLKKMANDRSAVGEELEFIEYIRNFTDQAESLVDSLLDFCVLGEKSVQLGFVDMAALAHQAASNLRANLGECGAEIEIADLPPAQADEGLLIHVLQNLFANGIKYRGDSSAQIRIEAQEIAGEIEYSVVDNGRGIDARYFTRIFEPFKRLTGRDQPDGVGLGLAICKRVIDAHHGRIWVESEIGVGSVFKFTLPVAQKGTMVNEEMFASSR